MAWLNRARPGHRCESTSRVPLQVGRRPALVHNAETLAQVALIARHGPAWFRSVGTAEAPGSTLVTVTGAVRWPGRGRGGARHPDRRPGGPGRAGDRPFRVLVGGYGGAWLEASLLATPMPPGRWPPPVPPAASAWSWPCRPRRAASPRRHGSPGTWPARAQANADRASSGCPPSPTTSSGCGQAGAMPICSSGSRCRAASRGGPRGVPPPRRRCAAGEERAGRVRRRCRAHAGGRPCAGPHRTISADVSLTASQPTTVNRRASMITPEPVRTPAAGGPGCL